MLRERDARWRKQRKKEGNCWNLIYFKEKKFKSLRTDTNILLFLQQSVRTQISAAECGNSQMFSVSALPMIYSTSNVPLLAMPGDPSVSLPSCSAVAATFLCLCLLCIRLKKLIRNCCSSTPGRGEGGGGGSPGDPALNIGIV